MGHDGWLESVRRATGHADQLVDLLAELPGDALQQIGDAVLATIEPDRTPALAGVVGLLIAGLDARQWDGDSELIAALTDATGTVASSLTRDAVCEMY